MQRIVTENMLRSHLCTLNDEFVRGMVRDASRGDKAAVFALEFFLDLLPPDKSDELRSQFTSMTAENERIKKSEAHRRLIEEKEQRKEADSSQRL